MSRPMTLEAFCAKHKITADVTYGGPEPTDDWQRSANPWTVTLRRGRRRLTTPYWTGSALGEPSAADVLGALMLDASSVEDAGGLFRVWCDNFGSTPDSRAAHDTWLACCALLPKLRRFLGELYDGAQSAEH